MSSVTRRPIKVLLVKHDPDDESNGIRDELYGSSEFGLDVEHVEELSAGLERLSHGGVDIVLLDLVLPDSQGMTTFERTHAFAPHVPIIVLTNHDDTELALATVQGGAQDYLIRGEVKGSEIVRSVRYAIERHRLLSALRGLSLLDELTGLYNRTGFLRLGEHFLRLARRSNRGGALLFFDIDRFRTINDAFGHHMGDRVLLKVAEILQSTVRISDLIARLGGDEFAILALESTAEPMDGLSGRILAAIREFNEGGKEPYHLAASIGLTRFDSDVSRSVDELLEDGAAEMLETRRHRGSST
jgi:two-component system cell cycle response regulator